MPIEKHTTQIDGHKYEISTLGATEGVKLFYRLFRMFGPSFGKLVETVSDSGSIQNVNLGSEAVSVVMGALTESVKEDDLTFLIDSMKKQTSVSVSPGSDKMVPMGGVFEVHFAGRMSSLARWLAWCMKVQYQSFFDVFASMKKTAEAQE